MRLAWVRIALRAYKHDAFLEANEAPCVINCYVTKSRRLLEVLDKQLAKAYLLGDDFTIVDIAMYPCG